MPRIPTLITHDDLTSSMKPLFDRLGVDANEVVGDIHIIRPLGSADHAYEIRFEVVASPEDVSASAIPDALRDVGHPQGDDWAIFTHRINVLVAG